MNNEKAIEAVVQAYRDGSFTGNAELLGSVFHPNGIVSGFFNGQEMSVPAADFVNIVCGAEETTEQKGCDFRCEIQSIVVDEPIASVRFLEFDDDGIDYTTYFQLMKTGSDWKVISKVFITV